MHVTQGLCTQCSDKSQEDWIESRESVVLFSSGESEVMLRKWMMERDTLGYSGQMGFKNLGELTSCD